MGFLIRGGAVERLWATHLHDGLYRLENAPAFAFGVSLHDVVEVVRDDEGNHWVMRVVEAGPFATVRVVLDALLPRALRLMKTIEATGCSFEKMNGNLYVAFGADADIAQLVSRLSRDGYRWEYVNPKREDVPAPDSSAAIERLVVTDVDPASQALVHLDAPWKERADDELEVLATVDFGKKRAELLPARSIDDRLWELCSAPFLASGFALGDIVEVDSSLRVLRRVSRSGRGAIVGFVDDADRVEHVSAHLVSLGCAVERRPRTGTLAIDSATPEIFDSASAWLGGLSDVVFEVLQAPRRAGEPDLA